MGIRDGPETQPSIIDDDEDDHGASDTVDKQVRSVGKLVGVDPDCLPHTAIHPLFSLH